MPSGEGYPQEKKICIKAVKFLVSRQMQAENFSACAQPFLKVKNRACNGEFRRKSCKSFAIVCLLLTQSGNTHYSSSSAGGDYNISHRRSSDVSNHSHEAEEQHNSAHDLHLIPPNLKNPCGLNQSEIICALALELVTASRSVINPLTKQPFRMKFGESFTM